jgi:DNA-binding SARP family transcriptional activator
MPTRIYLTAPIRVEGAGHAGERLLHGPQGRLALAMLALEHRRPVSRDELADELWPGDVPDSWEVSVKALISKLRTVLRGVAPDVRLEGTVGFYQLLVPSDTVIDVEIAASRIHAAEAAFRDGNIDAAAADALVASMIGARPFLPGFDGPWATTTRARVAEIRLRALDLLSRVWIAKGEPGQAARDAEAILGLDPYREEAWRTLIRAHIERGDRAGAGHVYRRLAARLATDLGVEPSDETRRLIGAMRVSPDR